MPDYIPAPDAAFDSWQANFLAVVTANPTAYGLTAGDLTVATALASVWTTKYPAHLAEQAAAQDPTSRSRIIS